jgi:C-terminal processing protease CtpA/Prc
MQGMTTIITNQEKQELLDKLIKTLEDNYVFPDVAVKMGEAIREKQANRGYDAIDDAKDLCKAVMADLQETSHDKHFEMWIESKEKEPIDEEKLNAKYARIAKSNNYGFHSVQRLEGNIGYIDLRAFYLPKDAAEVAIHAMNLVANTEALIFDLRKNVGGSPEMVAFLASYLFKPEAFLIDSFYLRSDDSLQQFWTSAYVAGERFGPDKPVYILTSSKTFSGGEEFAYNLKNLKRATVIGEVTGGGANPGIAHALTQNFRVFIPSGRAINPITQTNWEGVGVTPDIEVNQEKALDEAYKLALQYVVDQYANNDDYDFLVNEAQKALKEA